MVSKEFATINDNKKNMCLNIILERYFWIFSNNKISMPQETVTKLVTQESLISIWTVRNFTFSLFYSKLLGHLSSWGTTSRKGCSTLLWAYVFPSKIMFNYYLHKMVLNENEKVIMSQEWLSCNKFIAASILSWWLQWSCLKAKNSVIFFFKQRLNLLFYFLLFFFTEAQVNWRA